MSAKIELDDDPDHENLAISFLIMMAMEIKKAQTKRLGEAKAQAEAEAWVWDLACALDHEFIQIKNKKYMPRLCFVDEDGNILPGAADLDHLHEYAATPFDDTDGIELLRDE